MIFTSLCGVLAFFDFPKENMMRFGFIHIEKVLILFVSASICAHFGRRFQAHVNSQWRRGLLGSVLLILAVQMLFPLL